MNATVSPPETEARPAKSPRRWRRALLLALLPILILLCLGSVTLTILVNQTGLLGVAYLQSVHTGNAGLAALMGDHFSDDQSWHQRFYTQDIQRDSAFLQNLELSNVQTTREQTLSGQWVTMVRFQYREQGSASPWQESALRIKTDTWWFLTYIRAVEPTDP